MNFLYIFIVSSILHACNAKKKILIFGGNGFLGSHLINLLSEENHHITLVNRGNSYFDSDTLVTPFVDKHLNCDRNTLLRSTCPGLIGKSKFDIVVDFSSHHDQQIEQIIDILKGRVSLYILISSDAVYEVSEKQHEGKTREEDSRNDIKDIKKLEERIKENKYGASKKDCEERLQVQKKNLGFPYVILRLADAMGERDNSNRWWTYQIWMRVHQHFNTSISLPNGIKDHKFSMVYAKDVAKAINQIIEDPDIFHNHIINLAFKEDLTLTKILKFMEQYYSISEVSYDTNDKTGFFRYPSAQRGPIDLLNAEILLNWSPTKFEDAAANTMEFFDEAMVNPAFSREREVVLAEFIEEVLPESFNDEKLFVDVMTKVYSSAVFKGVDIGLNFNMDEDLIEGKIEL